MSHTLCNLSGLQLLYNTRWTRLTTAGTPCVGSSRGFWITLVCGHTLSRPTTSSNLEVPTKMPMCQLDRPAPPIKRYRSQNSGDKLLTEVTWEWHYGPNWLHITEDNDGRHKASYFTFDGTQSPTHTCILNSSLVPNYLAISIGSFEWPSKSHKFRTMITDLTVCPSIMLNQWVT